MGGFSLPGNVTTAQAALINRLDAIATGLADGDISAARVAALDNIVTAPLKGIKTVQSGTVSRTLAAANAIESATAAITAVDVSKSLFFFDGFLSNAGANRSSAEMTLTNGTTVTMRCVSTAAGEEVIGRFRVVEFN